VPELVVHRQSQSVKFVFDHFFPVFLVVPATLLSGVKLKVAAIGFHCVALRKKQTILLHVCLFIAVTRRYRSKEEVDLDHFHYFYDFHFQKRPNLKQRHNLIQALKHVT